MPDAAGAGRRVLDGLAGAAGLVGGAMLLSRRPRRAVAPASSAPGTVEFDDTARHGRGRPGAGPDRATLHAGHETRDANAGKLALVLTGLAVAVIAALVVLLLVMSLFRARLRADRPVLTGEQRTRLEPPPPLLEAHPDSDLSAERARELGVRDSYRWLDTAHTRAHVPIDRAMALAVGRPLDTPP